MTERDAQTGDELLLADGLRLPLEIVTATLAVLANRGSGKSSVAHRLVELMYGAGLPVVVLDVKGDWWGIRTSADGKGAGLPFVIFGGDHFDVPLEPTAGELLADLIVDDRIPAVLDLSHMSKTQARSFATAFAERLYRRNRDPLHVVIEEADVLVPQRATSDTARLLGAMEDIAKRGRHRGLGMSVVTQRPQEVAKSVLDMMETLVLLRITGPRSIKAVQDWISVNADQDPTTARDVVSSLPSLPVGEGWVWSPGFLRILQRARFPLFSTFDSHATPKPGQARVTPKVRADIDLEKLGSEITATRERARDNDPRALRGERDAARTELEEARQRAARLSEQLERSEQDRAEGVHELEALRQQVADLQSRIAQYPAAVESLRTAAGLIESALSTFAVVVPIPEKPGPRHAPRRRPPNNLPKPSVAAADVYANAGRNPSEVEVAQPAARPGAAVSTVKFRAGAQRMIEALARMAPLRMTKSQWSTVARIKHTGGSWSTYLGEIRRAGFLDEDETGYTLSEAGWAYVGRRPAPLTAIELQQHYLGILRSGAARMLQSVMEAYPEGLTREEVGERARIAVGGGSFSTYLGELRRNGLVEHRGELIFATEVLMHGSDANSLDRGGRAT